MMEWKSKFKIHVLLIFKLFSFSSEEGSHAPDEQENRLIDDVLNINVLCDNTRSKNSLAGAFFYC